MAWQIFQAIERNCRADKWGGVGYGSYVDVARPGLAPEDRMETFFIAETLKYLFLVFEDGPQGEEWLNAHVFNTEAHLFPRIPGYTPVTVSAVQPATPPPPPVSEPQQPEHSGKGKGKRAKHSFVSQLTPHHLLPELPPMDFKKASEYEYLDGVFQEKGDDAAWSQLTMRQRLALHEQNMNLQEPREQRNKCLAGTKGSFAQFPPTMLKTVMQWVREDTPFAWIRWADGDGFNSEKGTPMGQRLKDSVKKWETAGDHFFIAVGTHWLCSGGLKNIWNNLLGDVNSLFPTLVFLETFYLTMGDPADGHADMHRRNGVLGWIIESRGRHVAVVGPDFAKGLKFLNYTDFIEIGRSVEGDSSNVDKIQSEVRRVSESTSRGVLFVVIAGSLSKVLITEAFSTFASKDTFIDVGSAMDGYAGIKSKNFINIDFYCKQTRTWQPPDGLVREWMKPGVCPRL